MPGPALSPAHQLVGHQLQCGWLVTKKLTRAPGGTGGNFGVGYIAEKEGKEAFVKAIDFVAALGSADPIKELARLTTEAEFEKEALDYCGGRRMSRVIRLVAHEYVNVGPGALDRVSCLVMEFGPADLRAHITGTSSIPASWSIAVLSDVALALDQLHRGGVAHQDVKPSNVISMSTRVPPSVGATAQSANMKLGDLGRIVRKDVAGPFDDIPWPGDKTYSPPERWYGHRPSEWQDERDASDAFMLGSLIFFVFTGTPLQPLLFREMPIAYLPGTWTGTYDATLISVVRHAVSKCLLSELTGRLHSELEGPLIQIAKELTDPDPTLRGDPRSRRRIGRPVGIDRYHQRLRALSLRAGVLERVGR